MELLGKISAAAIAACIALLLVGPIGCELQPAGNGPAPSGAVERVAHDAAVELMRRLGDVTAAAARKYPRDDQERDRMEFISSESAKLLEGDGPLRPVNEILNEYHDAATLRRVADGYRSVR